MLLFLVGFTLTKWLAATGAILAPDAFAFSMRESPSSSCQYEPTTILFRNEHGNTALWQLEEGPQLYKSYSPGRDLGFKRFVEWIREHTPWNGIDLLKNHRKVGQDLLADPNLSEPARENLSKHVRNISYIIDGRVGRIRPITCLESIPFQQLLKVANLTQVGAAAPRIRSSPHAIT